MKHEHTLQGVGTGKHVHTVKVVKALKSILAVWLVFVLTMGAFPLSALEVRAATTPLKQPPVTAFRINGTASAGSSYYRLTMQWDWPELGLPDTTPNVKPNPNPNAETVVRPEWYEVHYRNATRSPNGNMTLLGVKDDIVDPNDAKNQVVSFDRSNVLMLGGSLYEFRVDAFHNNLYQTSNDPTDPLEVRPAPADTNTTQEKHVFLTDINVTLRSDGTTIIVEWDNVTFDGARVFDEYEIAYQEVKSVNDKYADNEKASGILSPSWADGEISEINNGTRLMYTISDPKLNPGQTYAVRLKPMQNGKTIDAFSSNSGDPFMINGTPYRIDCRNGAAFAYYSETGVTLNNRLEWDYEGDDYIRFFWPPYKNFTNLGSIGRIEIVEVPLDTVYYVYNQTVIENYVYTIKGSNSGSMLAAQTTEHFMPKPQGSFEKAYMLLLFKSIDESDRVPIGQSDVVIVSSEEGPPVPLKPQILALEANTDNDILSLDLTWQALTRYAAAGDNVDRVVPDPEDLNYPNGRQLYAYHDLSYDVYVVEDNVDLLDRITDDDNYKPIPFYSGALTPGLFTPEGETQPTQVAYQANLGTMCYYINPQTGQIDTKYIEENKIYFVQITTQSGSEGRRSKPARASVYVPRDSPVVVEPGILASPPLRVTGVTEKSMTVAWDVRYVEIYDRDNDRWLAEVDVNIDTSEGTQKIKMAINDILSKERLNALVTHDPLYPELEYEFLYGSTNGVKQAILNVPGIDLPFTDPTGSDILLRITDLSGASYKLHTVRYDHMVERGGYESYLNRYLSNDSDWTDTVTRTVPPLATPGELSYEITEYYPLTTALEIGAPAPMEANTAYVVYLRPFYTPAEGSTIYAFHPSYVMATTKNTTTPLEPEPPTPVLRGDYNGLFKPLTDMSATVYWLSVDEATFEYDLAYTDDIAAFDADGDGGVIIPWADIKDAYQIRQDEDGNPCMVYTFVGLFPDTIYNFRVRARVGTKESEWSNPVEMRTLDILPPAAPTSLGPAGSEQVLAYNRQNQTNYQPADPDALIIAWMRDDNDLAAPETAGTATGSTPDGGTATALAQGSAIYDRMYMVRFDGLLGNHPYYVRAKAVKTVTREGTGGTNLVAFSYIVQMSRNEDFSDCVEYTLPTLTPDDALDPIYAKRKESDWFVLAAPLYTGRTTGEYDGDVNPDQYPLPTEDWETTFDPATGTLTHRFRSDRTDANGEADQLTDQRFISRLVAERTFIYPLDLTSYGTQTVRTRVVEIPLSIMRAFNERQITLEVTAANAVLSIPPGCFETAAVRALADAGTGTAYTMTLASGDTGQPALAAGDRYVSDPQKLSVQVSTLSRTLTLDTFAKPVGIKMTLDNRVTPMEQNTGLYTHTANTGGWQLQTSRYSATEATLSASVMRAGTYAGIAKATPAVAASDTTRDAMLRVTNQINITDLTQYRSTETVTATRFNNLVAAVALNRNSVAMNKALSTADTQALTKAKLLVNGTVSREAAINALVTLYELKTKRIVQPSYTAGNAPFTDLATASEAYRTALLKAAEIGFVETGVSSTALRPKLTLRMGELMTMLDIILQDA